LNLPSTAVTSDYYAYLAGYRVFANPQDVDINLLATPGINWADNLLLTEEVIDVIEDKEDGRGGDTLYIMASPNMVDVNELAEKFEESCINSSHACTYAPWIMYYDSSNKKYLSLPVTKDVVRNMAATDNNSYPWFAPAGMERGGVNCVKADFKTTLADEDVLYENRINPVKTFAQDGVKIWGNKTAYNVDSPLNRINVRRLMIRVQKLVKSAAKNLIFTQYDDTLDKQFRGLIEPILADVKANRGISDYRILTEVTPETRDQHILPAKILIKPTPALEYISISFVVYPDSVSFDEN
jgi:phage tail sheath protein FI